MEIDIKQVLLQILNFGVLFFVLAKFLFKPILKVLDDRADKINAGLLAATKNLKAVEESEKRQREEIASSEKKAAALILAARNESKKAGTELIEEAKAEGAKQLAKQEAAFFEKLRSEEVELQKRLGKLVTETTKKVLVDSLSASELKSVTKKAVEKLGKK